MSCVESMGLNNRRSRKMDNCGQILLVALDKYELTELKNLLRILEINIGYKIVARDRRRKFVVAVKDQNGLY